MKFPATAHLNAQVRHNLSVDTMAASFFALFAGSLYPFLAALAVQLGAREIEVGILVAAPFVAQIFSLYWGHICQNVDRKLPYIVFPGLFARLLIIPLALMQNASLFILMIILHHLLGAIAFPAFTGLVLKIYPLQYRARLMGIVRFVFGLVHVLATAVAGILIDTWGYTPVFLVVALLGMTASLIMLRIQEPQGNGKRSLCRNFSLKENLSLLVKKPALGWFVLGVTFLEGGYLMVQPYFPLYWVHELGLSNVQIGQISMFFMGFWFMASPLWGSIIDRTRPLLAVYAAVPLYLIVPLLYLGNPSFAGVLMAASLLGLGMAGFESGWSNHLMAIGGDNATLYVGLYYSLVGVRGLIAPLLGSVLLRHVGPQSTLILAMILMALTFGPLAISQRKIAPPAVLPSMESQNPV